MSSTLVLSDLGDETWGAVLEDGVVVELHVENSRRPGVAGNIYKGRVGRILPGMQAAFVDVGIERDTFLHVADLPAAYLGPAEFPGVDEDDEVAPDAPAEGDRTVRSRTPGAGYVPIQDLLREGQEIVVQISKEAIAAKGARVTAQIGLPGRALVSLPNLDRVFVSRRIEGAAERERLISLTARAGQGAGGWIVRTAAEDAPEAVLTRDVAYLTDLWASIRERERKSGAPALLHRDQELAERLLRDVLAEGFGEVIVDSARLEAISTGFVERYLSGLGIRVRRTSRGWGTFDELGIHQEIERALGSRLTLKSGGTIIVNPTEALVAIDVNTGRYVGKRSLEETALRTNLEAVREIVRLLRLRDLGGIIVIDFIDMVESTNREALSAALQNELRKDRSRTRLLAMSDFGLVQLTRKRTRRSLDRALQGACPGCGGSGRVRSALALYYQIERELVRGAALAGSEGPLVRLHPASLARIDSEGLRFGITRGEGTAGSSGAGGGAGSAQDGTSRVEGGATGASRSPRVQADASLSEESYEIIW